ncbi:MAG: hypothetical protein WC641_08235 [Patescibacteria group bacterium]
MIYYRTRLYIFAVANGYCSSILDVTACKHQSLPMLGCLLLGGVKDFFDEAVPQEEIKSGMRLKFRCGESTLCTEPVEAVVTDAKTDLEAVSREPLVTLPESFVEKAD